MRARVAFVGAVALAACSDRKSAAPPPSAAIVPNTKAAAATPVIPKKTAQLVTAVVDDWTSTKATLQYWSRMPGARGALEWSPVGPSWTAVIGRAGSAWGIGLHGNGAPNREGPLKKEGDGKSPAGAFALRAAYGVADDLPPGPGAKLPYETTGAGDWECVDDPGSEHYGQIVERKAVASDWVSSEQLLRDDDLYKWIIDVAHNPERIKSKGSCIFLHVWGGPETSTSGCTAMPELTLTALLNVLDPGLEPVYVLLPREDYKALAPAWGLPPLTP
ncbi:MAG: hypothetical protein HOV81_15510 [Kofleriaceae bacterium]|nr:hypothetical protein [Kofleriaceae bacterium]